MDKQSCCIDVNETIAWICCSDTLCPWTTKPGKTFYRVIIRKNVHLTNPSVHVSTSCVSGEYREVKVRTKDRNESNLRNILHTLIGRREVARAISILTQCSYVDKKDVMESVLQDMRFLEPPFELSYVDCNSICPGTILDVQGFPENKTNKFTIRPKGENGTRVIKVGGEVNIPLKSWMCE